MKNSNKSRCDDNSILIALDQISQTIDVMTNVVEKLRGHLIEKSSKRNSLRTDALDQTLNPRDRTIH